MQAIYAPIDLVLISAILPRVFTGSSARNSGSRSIHEPSIGSMGASRYI
jgi:hypothetical protein